MPFAGYKDFADCVAKNRDKNNPDAYCAFIERQVIGKEKLAKKAAAARKKSYSSSAVEKARSMK